MLALIMISNVGQNTFNLFLSLDNIKQKQLFTSVLQKRVLKNFLEVDVQILKAGLVSNFIKKEAPAQIFYFPVNFKKFSRTPLFYSTSWLLFLIMLYIITNFNGMFQYSKWSYWNCSNIVSKGWVLLIFFRKFDWIALIFLDQNFFD